MSPIPQTPQISENSTNGTTNILNALINKAPTVWNNPLTTYSLVNEPSILVPDQFSVNPTIIPKPMPMSTFAVRFIIYYSRY